MKAILQNALHRLQRAQVKVGLSYSDNLSLGISVHSDTQKRDAFFCATVFFNDAQGNASNESFYFGDYLDEDDINKEFDRMSGRLGFPL